MAEQKRVKLVA